MAAVATAVLGVVLVAQMIASRSPTSIVVPPGQEARGGGLTLRIDVAEWLSHSMLQGMPASAMTDMPAAGEQRLRLAITLMNEGSGARDLGPDDFLVRSSSGESWTPMRSNFLASTLWPGQALNGSISFHVPETESGLRLIWTSGDTEMEIPVSDMALGDRGYGGASLDDGHDH